MVDRVRPNVCSIHASASTLVKRSREPTEETEETEDLSRRQFGLTDLIRQRRGRCDATLCYLSSSLSRRERSVGASLWLRWLGSTLDPFVYLKVNWIVSSIPTGQWFRTFNTWTWLLPVVDPKVHSFLHFIFLMQQNRITTYNVVVCCKGNTYTRNSLY